jgi:hypothetical protein
MKREQRPRGRRISRRQFLAGSAAAGIAISLPGLLGGCGSDDDGGGGSGPSPSSPSGPRESRTLHFDLSFAEVSDLRLVALASRDHGAELQAHDDESRALFRKHNRALGAVPDDRLTHYLEDIDLPATALQHIWVTGTHVPSGESALIAARIHVPRLALQRLHGALLSAGQFVPSAKLRAYGIDTVEGVSMADLLAEADEFTTPWDTAADLVFHDPQIMNLNTDKGTRVHELIQTLPCTAGDENCKPFLDTLAFRIAQYWPARMTPGGWATVVQMTDAQDGTPLFDDNGEPIYVYELSDETVAAAQSTLRAVRESIFNDPRYEGDNWHEIEGMTVRNAKGVSAPRAGQFQLVAEHATGTTVNGVSFVELDVTDQGKRTVQVGVKNRYLRSHSVHVQFANEQGPLPFTPADNLDSERAAFVDVAFTNDTLLGIPLVGDLVETQHFKFDVPPAASKAIVSFGSLGVGGEAFCPEALYGSVLTLGFNLGIPVIFLAIGAAIEAKEFVAPAAFTFRAGTSPLRSAVNLFLARVLRRVIATGGPDFARGIYATADSGSAQPFLIGLSNAALQLLLNLVPGIAQGIAIKTGVAAGVSLVPLAWVVKLLSAGAVAAEIAQTIGEVVTNPALFTNTLSLVMTTTVRIEHDPMDFRFPARARKYSVTLTYDEASKLAHKQEGAIEPDRVKPIDVVFNQVPSGGKVTVDIVLTTDEGYIIGRSVDSDGKEGPVGPIPNTPDMAGTIEVPIKERLIPLTQQTRYQHDTKLAYQNGKRDWVSGPAPAATRAVLCQGQDDRLCNLGGITISQLTGMAGYSFQAGGQGNRPFCGESGGGVMYLIENLFLGQGAENGLKTIPCGFHHPAGIVYDRLGPGDGSGRNFFLEPTPDGASYFLESIVLDSSTPIQLNNPLAWGRFTQALESVAVVPTGYVVGVSRLNHKMEILQLPKTAVDRDKAPEAVPFSVIKGGLGTREGLLNAPVAVAVRDATILVLETGNARIQAFDVSANPVKVFKNGTSATVELEKTADVEYLDIAVEGLGYMYVLSAANGGLSVDDYRLDVFTPQGNLLSRTIGVAAARMAVDTFRNVYTLNFETLAGAPRVEPTLSQWVPSTPSA